MKLVDKLKVKGVHIERPSDQQGNLKNRWEYIFLKDISPYVKWSIALDQYLWHVFGYEKLQCLKGVEAVKTFNGINKYECYVFYQHGDRSYVLKNTQNISAEDFDNENDIYIVDKDFTWTYVHTHEINCGPYFYKR